MKNDVQERAVDAQRAVVLNESEFAETIHEKAHPRSGGADHFRQRLLAYFGDDQLGSSFFPDAGKQQQCPR